MKMAVKFFYTQNLYKMHEKVKKTFYNFICFYFLSSAFYPS